MTKKMPSVCVPVVSADCTVTCITVIIRKMTLSTSLSCLCAHALYSTSEYVGVVVATCAFSTSRANATRALCPAADICAVATQPSVATDEDPSPLSAQPQTKTHDTTVILRAPCLKTCWVRFVCNVVNTVRAPFVSAEVFKIHRRHLSCSFVHWIKHTSRARWFRHTTMDTCMYVHRLLSSGKLLHFRRRRRYSDNM